MIYNVVGQEFIYEGVTYRVGAEVVGTAESDYRGLNGFILEIRTGDDRETENETPDIHCYFDPPCLPSDIKDSKNVSLHCMVLKRNWKTLLWTMLLWLPTKSSCCRALEKP